MDNPGTPAYLEGGRKKEHWRSQSVFALDFDSGFHFDDVQSRLQEYGLDCTFAYRTFSDSPEKPKFRVVWALDVCVIDIDLRDAYQQLLMFLFPEADKRCKDGSRLYFGGKGLICENYDYALPNGNEFYRMVELHRATTKGKNRNLSRVLSSLDAVMRKREGGYSASK